MKILLLTAYFPPDTGSAAHLFYELGRAFVERGHGVTVLTGMPGYHALGPLEKYKGKKRIKEDMEGMEVVRVAMPQLPRHLMVGRALWQFGGAWALFLAGLGLPKADAAIVYSPPLPLGLTAWGLKKLQGLPFILNVQDLFPQSIIDLGLLRNRWLIRFFEEMERFVYRHANIITVHSEGNREHVMRKLDKGQAEKVKVIPNWVDVHFIQPGPRMNWFREAHGLGDAFVVSFAGVLGYSQDLDVVLDAARILEDGGWRSEILFLIVGDGVERPRLEAKARQMGLNNVRFLPMQPREKYPAVLHASDVGLATLHAEVRTPVVPSKILSIMAAGRPVVAAMNLDGDGPRLIAEARCGLCVPPEDPRALAEAILQLYHDASLREELGRNGRRYVEKYLSLEACVERYEQLLRQVI
jgi:colanic acid biosynthesis glycosyl transferase WcaI